jgi:hypothetical protein
MATTTQGSLRYPTSGNSTNVPQDIQNLATDVDSKIVNRYATTTARNAAITSPVNGQLAFTGGQLYLYSDSLWRLLPKAVAGGSLGVTLSAGGDVNITHGLGATPTYARVDANDLATFGIYAKMTVHTLSSTIIGFRAYDTRTGSVLAGGTAGTVLWSAYIL